MKTIKLLLIGLLFLSTCSKDDETIQDPVTDPEPENLEQVFRDKLEGVWESSYMLRSDGTHAPYEYNNNGNGWLPFTKILTFVGDSIFYDTSRPYSVRENYQKGTYDLKVSNDSLFIKKEYSYYDKETLEYNSAYGYTNDGSFWHVKFFNDTEILYGFYVDEQNDVYKKQ
jgi:hypothetical protein